MNPPVMILERATHHTLLGLRFWDPVEGRVVSDGLAVSAYPTGQPDRRVSAVANRRGAFAFPHLPGMRGVEYGLADPFAASPPAGADFVVEVEDADRRFLPFSCDVRPPVLDFFIPACVAGSPPSRTPGIPLFSSPTRRTSAGMAVLRAALWDGANHRPAAWAILEVQPENSPAVRGMADDRGEVVVIFPYPEPQQFGPISPPGSPPSGRQALTSQSWPVPIRAYYGPISPAPSRPDLCQAITQPLASLWADWSPPTPLTSVTIEFGKELVVRTASQPSRIDSSWLLISPAGAPPGFPPA